MIKINVRNSTEDNSTDIKNKELLEDQFIIQIEKANSKLDLIDIKEILNDTGVKLDDNYGPYCVNPKLGRYVVRGTANTETQKKLRNIPGIKIFLDKKIQPTDK
jgi:hypothetical protein